jgi:hypothetical protein
VISYDFVSATAPNLDALQTDLIVLPFFSDERPLRGAAGLIDWRLCGTLSRQIMAGYLDGTFAEKGLIASPPKLKSEGLLLVGLGASAAFDARVSERACAVIANALTESRVANAALALPGRSMGLLPALQCMQLWLTVSLGHAEVEEISIIERAEEHRALDSLFDGLRRQAESPLD